MPIRLQKHIANQGICSRRKAEELIKLGKVKVNEKTITEMGIKIDPEKDKVEVNQKTATPHSSNIMPYIYIALNKPIDYITSATSNQGKSVIDLLAKTNNVTPKKARDITERVYPAGRLDKDSEGLLIITNDGNLTNQLTHPRFEHSKLYEITINMPLSKDAKKVLEAGMLIGDEKFQGIKIKKEFNKAKQTIVTIELKEGKNRQIRKMFGRLGYHVASLKRIQIGKLKLGVLPIGRWKFINKDQII